MARILHDGRTYHLYEYDSEEEFERAVVQHSREIFGPNTAYFDIKRRLGNENVLTIPDGYLLDFSFQHSPRLYIIENELVEHDPFRHIGQQLLKFATAYEESRHKLKQALSTEIQSDAEKRAFIRERAEEAEIRNVDVLLDEVIYDKRADAIVVIDEVTVDLENVLGQLTMGTDVVQLKTYVQESDLIHHVEPFQQDVRDVADEGGAEVDPEELDTVVVPARREGFEETFLGEDCWYKKCHWMNVVGPGDLRVGSVRLERFEYDLELKFGTVGALTHGAYRWIGCGLQETKRPASQPHS